LALSYFADTAFWIALFRRRDQFHDAALSWQRFLLGSGAVTVTTEAVCWEWMNAMSGVGTRTVAAQAFDRILRDPRVEVIPHGPGLSGEAIRLFTARSDKQWSLTDCASFAVMAQRDIREALTADAHFEQAGFRSLLLRHPQE